MVLNKDQIEEQLSVHYGQFVPSIHFMVGEFHAYRQDEWLVGFALKDSAHVLYGYAYFVF